MSEYPEFEDFLKMIDDPDNKNYHINSLWDAFLRKLDEIRKEKQEHS